METLIQSTKDIDSRQVQLVLNATKYFSFSQALSNISGSGASTILDTLDEEQAVLQRLERVDDAVYRLTLSSPDDHRVMVVIDPAGDDPKANDEVIQTISERVNRRFFLDVNMDDVRDALAINQYGKEIIKMCWPVRPVNYGGAWEAMLKSLVHAQIFPGLATKLDEALITNYGERISFGDEQRAMLPRPVELARANEEALRDMRFSRQKASYLTGISGRFLKEPNKWDFDRLRQLPGKEAVTTLKELKGVGPWTAQNVAMRGLPHPDVFIDEKNTRETLAPYYGDRDDTISKKQLEQAAAEFAPFRSFACYYTYMKRFDM